MAKNLESMSADELRSEIYQACKILEKIRGDYDPGHAEMGDIVALSKQIHAQIIAAGVPLPRIHQAADTLHLLEYERLMHRIKAAFANKDTDEMDGFQLAEAAKGEIEQAKELRRQMTIHRQM